MKKRRRKFVRGQLISQGIKPNRDVVNRSKKERDARARARAAFDKQAVREGAEAQAVVGRTNTDAARDIRNQAASDRLTGQAARTSAADRKPADRYPEPARPVRPEDGVQNRPKPGSKSPSATRPGADRTDRSRPRSGPQRENRMIGDTLGIGKPTIDRPRLDETRGGGRPTINRPRMPGNRPGNRS